MFDAIRIPLVSETSRVVDTSAMKIHRGEDGRVNFTGLVTDTLYQPVTIGQSLEMILEDIKEEGLEIIG